MNIYMLSYEVSFLHLKKYMYTKELEFDKLYCPLVWGNQHEKGKQMLDTM